MKPENVDPTENLLEYGLLPKPGTVQDFPARTEMSSPSDEGPAPVSSTAKAGEPVLPATPAHLKNVTIL